MLVQPATDQRHWDEFLDRQRFSPFLQSWTMGEVCRDIGQEPIRLMAKDGDAIVGICQGIYVPARRGRHIAVMYGPVTASVEIGTQLLQALSDHARERGCGFVRVSPFVPAAEGGVMHAALAEAGLRPARSPLHLLAEHAWYLPLCAPDVWSGAGNGIARSPEEILAAMRKTTRNLIRRAEKDGVTVRASTDPIRDVEAFIALHDETRKRHKFTPYSNAFFRAQVRRFAPRGECTVYLADYQGKTISASIHMHAFGETSYHHGASDSAHHKIPASYLLQWTAITDALKRGDRVYNFWGIAPMRHNAEGSLEIQEKHHPFAGVTLFKTGFGGHLLDLQPCIDLPLTGGYHLTRAFEIVRKWKRGF